MGRFILHSDLNNFYASVEMLENPNLKNIPFVVVGDASKRHGIVLAKNYIAKNFGVKTGDTIWQAQIKCNGNLQTVIADLAKYIRVSKKVKDIYKTYSNYVESFGIDEAWLDISKLCKTYSQALEIAELIRTEVKEKIGITVSIGVSFNKIFAKLGSDLKKPDAISIITEGNFKTYIWPLKANELLFVGKSTEKILEKYDVKTIGDIANANKNFLKNLLGKMGSTLWEFANGLDNSPVKKVGEFTQIKSIGNSTTTPIDLKNIEQIKSVFYILSESVAYRMRAYGFYAKVIQIFIKDNSLMHIVRSITLETPTNLVRDIFKESLNLFLQNHNVYEKCIRALGVRVSGFTNKPSQLNFFYDFNLAEKFEKSEIVVEKIREKYGYHTIKRGIVKCNESLSDLNPFDDAHQIHPVSYV